MQPKADHQGSKIPFRDYRWVGPFIIQKVLPNENYIVRRLNTNKTQILHRIRLKTFVPNQPIEDNFRQERLQQDEEIVIPQDDLYTITWETNFGEQLATRGNELIPTSLPNGERPITTEANTSDANENKADYIITTDRPNAESDAAPSQNERMKSDVSNRNEDTEAVRNENTDCPDSAVYHKNQEISLPDQSERQENDASFWEGNSANENDAENSPKKGLTLSCPKYPKMTLEMKTWVLEVGDTISGLILIQTLRRLQIRKDWIYPKTGILLFL